MCFTQPFGASEVDGRRQRIDPRSRMNLLDVFDSILQPNGPGSVVLERLWSCPWSPYNQREGLGVSARRRGDQHGPVASFSTTQLEGNLVVRRILLETFSRIPTSYASGALNPCSKAFYAAPAASNPKPRLKSIPAPSTDFQSNESVASITML